MQGVWLMRVPCKGCGYMRIPNHLPESVEKGSLGHAARGGGQRQAVYDGEQPQGEGGGAVLHDVLYHRVLCGGEHLDPA